jgi:hypothetical protein
MDGRAGATLSLNVLSFQTSFETWTTAAIINWKKLLRLSVVSKLEEISSLRPALPSGPYQPHISFILKSNMRREKEIDFKMKEDVNGLVGLRRWSLSFTSGVSLQILISSFPSQVEIKSLHQRSPHEVKDIRASAR